MKAERKRSTVWRYFTAAAINTASYDVCRKQIHYYGNPTNIYLHKNTLKGNPKLQTKQKKEERDSQTRTRPLALRQRSLAEAFQHGQADL